MSIPNRTARRATWVALPLGLALVGALALSPALAQDAASGTSNGGAPGAGAETPDAAPRAGASSFVRRGPDGAFAVRGMRFDARGGGVRGALGERFGARSERRHEPFGARAERRHARFGAEGDAFARWLGADVDGGPIVPGLVGRLADGASVRLAFYAGAPDRGGAELAAVTFVAGEGDAAAFRAEVRTAAEGATHVVVDVLGRVVALPEAAPTEGAE